MRCSPGTGAAARAPSCVAWLASDYKRLLHASDYYVGDVDQARAVLGEARDLFHRMGNEAEAAELRVLLDSLDERDG